MEEKRIIKLSMRVFALLTAVGLVASLISCSNSSQDTQSGKLKVLATTTIVGDVVQQVGDDLIDLEVLLPIGTDPHTFTPTPQDLAKISDAEVLVMNGVGLEAFMQTYLDSVENSTLIIDVSEGIKIIEASDNSEHVLGDPHTWTDPANVKVWVENISSALSEIDPVNSKDYQANADAYTSKLDELNTWIEAQVAQIPQEKRKIVSDHESLAYFTLRYGFTQIGTVIPGTSTLSEPSAQDVARLEDLIRTENVPAIFVDTAANPKLSERISNDAGAKIIFIYSGSLTDENGDAGSYLDYMRYNVSAIVEALR